MTNLSKTIADALDIDLPDNEPDTILPVVVEPHEVFHLENPELPDLSDAERRIVEGEKQLEEIITHCLSNYNEAKKSIEESEPKYRNRAIENATTSLTIALDSIKTKLDFQLRKKEARLKEANFVLTKKTPEGNQITNNVFMGTREEMLKFLANKMNEETT